MVGLRYLVDAHKIPFRKRSKGRGRAEEGKEASGPVFFGRPRRFGATQSGGAMRKVSISRTLQMWSVSPAAIAGVSKTSPLHPCV